MGPQSKPSGAAAGLAPSAAAASVLAGASEASGATAALGAAAFGAAAGASFTSAPGATRTSAPSLSAAMRSCWIYHDHAQSSRPPARGGPHLPQEEDPAYGHAWHRLARATQPTRTCGRLVHARGSYVRAHKTNTSSTQAHGAHTRLAAGVHGSTHRPQPWPPRQPSAAPQAPRVSRRGPPLG